MFRQRLFMKELKLTNTINNQTWTQAPAQAGIENFNGIFQERLRGIVREGLLLMFGQEVTVLCGETYRPTDRVHRRAGNEGSTIQTTASKECFSKRRVREMLPSGLERDVKLWSYSEVKRRKGMFNEVLESICHGASGGFGDTRSWLPWAPRSRGLASVASLQQRSDFPIECPSASPLRFNRVNGKKHFPCQC